MSSLEMVIGLEVHVQLRTRTKAFCDCLTSFGDPPNRNTCPVCLGLPGALPVLNEAAVRLAVRAALALECTVHPTSIFARKNYFYPDLPKGYQISQYDRPLATGGQLHVDLGDSVSTIGITRVHMEEDAGKSIHDRYPGETAIDLNRSGVPLIEIVSEPDMRSPTEAAAYLRALKEIMQYTDVSDVNMEEGSLRVDANLSVRERGETRLGTKTEVKNMNSFSGVERALHAEFERQCSMLARGEQVQQQTLLWDASRGEVRPARSKEQSHDYRYFPEPDLPPLRVGAVLLEQIAADLPELPAAKRQRFVQQYGIPAYDSGVLTADRGMADFFEAVVAESGDAKAASSWIMGDLLAELNASGRGLRELPLDAAALAALIRMVDSGAISRTAGKKVFQELAARGGSPEAIADQLGLRQVGDDSQLTQWIDEAFAEHPAEAERFRAGERKLQGVFVGFVMKKSRGSADPRKLSQLLSERSGG